MQYETKNNQTHCYHCFNSIIRVKHEISHGPVRNLADSDILLGRRHCAKIEFIVKKTADKTTQTRDLAYRLILFKGDKNIIRQLIHKITEKFDELGAVLIENVPFWPLQPIKEKTILTKLQGRREFGVKSSYSWWLTFRTIFWVPGTDSPREKGALLAKT